jgi:hypothetical protein
MEGRQGNKKNMKKESGIKMGTFMTCWLKNDANLAVLIIFAFKSQIFLSTLIHSHHECSLISNDYNISNQKQ